MNNQNRYLCIECGREEDLIDWEKSGVEFRLPKSTCPICGGKIKSYEQNNKGHAEGKKGLED